MSSALVLLVIAAPAGAAQSNSDATELGGPSDGSSNPSEVATGAGGGESAVAWHVSEGGGFTSTVFLSRRGAGAWGAPEAVSREDGAEQNGKEGLAVDAHGDVLLAWEGENRAGSDLYIDEVPKGQSARRAVDLWHDAVSVNGIDQVTVSFDGTGDATVMWRGGSGLYLVRRPAGGTFGSPVQIADAPEMESLNWPSFASGENGDVAVAGNWDYGGVAAWVVPRGSGPGGMEVLQREGSYSGSVRVAMAPDGEAIAAWYTQEYHEEGESGFDGWLTVSVRSPGASSFSPPKRVDPVPNLEGLALAVSSTGEATLVYNHVDELVAVSRARGGEWRSPEDVGNGATEEPAAAYDASGSLYLAWHQYTGLPESAGEDGYYVATRPAGSTFDGQPREISRTIPDIGSSPVVSLSDEGAFVAWALYDEGWVEVAGPIQASTQKEGATAPSAPNSSLTVEPQAQPSLAVQPAGSAPESGSSGVPAAKLSRTKALASGLVSMLQTLSAHPRHPQLRVLRFRSPSAGLLTIMVSVTNHEPGRESRISSMSLGRWVLRHAGSVSLRIAASRRLAALLAKPGTQLTATFQPKQGPPTTARVNR